VSEKEICEGNIRNSVHIDMMNNEVGNVPVRVLGIQGPKIVTTTAIDMNIWGYGEDRCKSLDNLIHQLSFRLSYMRKTGMHRLSVVEPDHDYEAVYNRILLDTIKGSVPDNSHWICSIPLKDLVVLDSSSKISRSPDVRIASMKCLQLPQFTIISSN